MLVPTICGVILVWRAQGLGQVSDQMPFTLHRQDAPLWPACGQLFIIPILKLRQRQVFGLAVKMVESQFLGSSSGSNSQFQLLLM